MSVFDTFHEIGLDLRPFGGADVDGYIAVTIDGREIRGVEHVSVDAPADGIPRVTLRLAANRITGPSDGQDPESSAEVLQRIEKLLRQSFGYKGDLS